MIEDAPEEARRCFESGYRAQVARRLGDELAGPVRGRLSRVYVMQGKLDAAIVELGAALELEPDYVAARRELHRVRGILN